MYIFITNYKMHKKYHLSGAVNILKVLY